MVSVLFYFSAKVPNSAILECQDFTTIEGKWFNDPITEKFNGRRIGQNGQ